MPNRHRSRISASTCSPRSTASRSHPSSSTHSSSTTSTDHHSAATSAVSGHGMSGRATIATSRPSSADSTCSRPTGPSANTKHGSVGVMRDSATSCGPAWNRSRCSTGRWCRSLLRRSTSAGWCSSPSTSSAPPSAEVCRASPASSVAILPLRATRATRGSRCSTSTGTSATARFAKRSYLYEPWAARCTSGRCRAPGDPEGLILDREFVVELIDELART